jgi:hypothetical protein
MVAGLSILNCERRLDPQRHFRRELVVPLIKSRGVARRMSSALRQRSTSCVAEIGHTPRQRSGKGANLPLPWRGREGPESAQPCRSRGVDEGRVFAISAVRGSCREGQLWVKALNRYAIVS